MVRVNNMVQRAGHNALSSLAISRLVAEGFIGWGICRYASQGRALDWAIRHTNETGWITAGKNRKLSEDDVRGLYLLAKEKRSDLQLIALMGHPAFPLDLARSEFLDNDRGHHLVAASYPGMTGLLDSFSESDADYGIFVDKLAKLLTSSKIADKSIFTRSHIEQVFGVSKDLIKQKEHSTFAYRVNLLIERLGADKTSFSDEDIVMIVSSTWADSWVRDKCFNILIERNIHGAGDMPVSWAKRLYDIPDEGFEDEIIF